MQTYFNLWQRVLIELERTTDEDTYQELFQPLNEVHKFEKGLLYVICPFAFNKSRIERFFKGQIDDLLQKFSGENIHLKLYTKEDIEKEIQQIEKDNTIGIKPGDLNATYTFKNFVVGDSNRFAFRAALKVACQPGMVANPLYIFGGVGLGKTHLMQAIGNEIIDNDVNKKVLYIKADTFREDYRKASFNERRNENSLVDPFEEFNRKYRELDCLLIDDIQILSNSTKTQTEFFKLFDILSQNNKQIVITSDCPARELNIMDRLTSRFESGLTIDIKIPDLNHRIEILRQKLISETTDTESVPDEVLSFIASSFSTNIRELEGALKRVMFYCIMNEIDITLDSTKEALEALLEKNKKTDALNENNYDKILSIVSDYYKVTVNDIIGKQRLNKYTTPRHIAMFLIKKLYDISYEQIGSIFGNRHYSTVLSACEKIENEINNKEDLRIAVENLTKKVEKKN